VGTAGGSDYAVVSFGRERLCLVGFRPDGGTNGPACAAPAVAEDPTTPLAIFGPLEKGKGAVAVLAPTGTASVVLHSEQGAVRAPIASGFAYAASDAPAVSMTVRASDGESVRTPLYADAGTGAAFAISVQEAVRRDQLAGGASDLDAALKPAAGFAGLAVDYAADRFIRVGVAADATAAEQAELHAIVGRFPQLAREVEFVAKPLSSTDLEALMHDVERAWGNDPSFVSIGIGDGVIDVTHLTGKPLPRAVQAIVDRQPQLFRIESGSYPQTD
jgi:hypothetical protein